jgi:hypothetical protein
LCIKAQKVHPFRPSLGFLVEARPRVENRRGQKALFGAQNVFRVRLIKHELNVNFKVTFDRCQVRCINWKFYIFSYIPLFTLCISGNEHENDDTMWRKALETTRWTKWNSHSTTRLKRKVLNFWDALVLNLNIKENLWGWLSSKI